MTPAEERFIVACQPAGVLDTVLDDAKSKMSEPMDAGVEQSIRDRQTTNVLFLAESFFREEIAPLFPVVEPAFVALVEAYPEFANDLDRARKCYAYVCRD